MCPRIDGWFLLEKTLWGSQAVQLEWPPVLWNPRTLASSFAFHFPFSPPCAWTHVQNIPWSREGQCAFCHFSFACVLLFDCELGVAASMSVLARGKIPTIAKETACKKSQGTVLRRVRRTTVDGIWALIYQFSWETGIWSLEYKEWNGDPVLPGLCMDLLFSLHPSCWYSSVSLGAGGLGK